LTDQGDRVAPSVKIARQMAKSKGKQDDESVWDHLAGARSAPFEVGEQKRVAVKVIDDRGNELLVVKALP